MKKIAWCLLIALALYACACAEERAASVAQDVRLRASPDTDSEILATLKAGSSVTVLQYGSEWCRVEVPREAGAAEGAEGEAAPLSGYAYTPCLALDLEDLVPDERVRAVEATFERACALPADGNYSFDLDGDGEAEDVSLFPYDGDEFYTFTCLRIADASGAHAALITPIHSRTHAYIAYLDSEESACAVVLSGMQEGGYPFTLAYSYADGKISPIPFECGGEKGTAPAGDTVSLEKGTLTLSRRFDLFGTRFASRAFEYRGGTIAPADGTAWDFGEMTDEEFDLCALTLKQELAAISSENVLRLPASTRLILTSVSDGGACTFLTEDGQTGYFQAEPVRDSYTHTVNGIPEDELFEGMQYAN